MAKLTKLAVLAGAAGVAAAVVMYAATASPRADAEGGKQEEEEEGSTPRAGRSRQESTSSRGSRRKERSGSLVRSSRERNNSWAEPLYKRTVAPGRTGTKVVDDMLRNAKRKLDIMRHQAAQLFIPPPRPRKASLTGSDTSEIAPPSEATRQAVLQCVTPHHVTRAACHSRCAGVAEASPSCCTCQMKQRGIVVVSCATCVLCCHPRHVPRSRPCATW